MVRGGESVVTVHTPVRMSTVVFARRISISTSTTASISAAAIVLQRGQVSTTARRIEPEMQNALRYRAIDRRARRTVCRTMCWLTDPETCINEARAVIGVNAITVAGRSRRIWTGPLHPYPLRGRHSRPQPDRRRALIRILVLLRDRSSSAISMHANKELSVRRTFSGRAGSDDANVFAEAIR
jgi:hypothetical protein